MSFWMHAFCNDSVASVTPDELIGGIAERLTRLTYLYCPEEEEDPKAVLCRLRIEKESPDASFRTFFLYYLPNLPVFIRMDRSEIHDGLEELYENVLAHRKEPEIAMVRHMLASVKEDVTFCLKVHDLQGMGFPLSMAAAAYLVERAGGLIQSGAYSWLWPNGKEVDVIAEINP